MKVSLPAICTILALDCAVAATTQNPAVARFALCQTPALESSSPELVDEVFLWVRERLSGEEDAVVLPEYAFTTFSDFGEAWRYAPEVWAKSAAFAAENAVWLFVNHPTCENDAGSPKFNETRVFSPEGEVVALYRKRVLANMDGAAGMSPGTDTVIADLPFGRVGLLICKDAQYPERGGAGYAAADMLLVQLAHPGVDDSAAPEAEFFPTSDKAAGQMQGLHAYWDFLSIPFLAVNKTGPDGNYTLCGGTFAADGDGDFIVRAETGPDVVLVDFPLQEDGRVASPPPFAIALDANGGSPARAEVEVARGEPIGALATPMRKGYKFLGWYNAKSGGTKVSASTKPSRDMTIYARWAASTYKIAFSANGGTLPKGKKMPAQTLTYGKSAKLAANAFTRSGCVFIGWAKTKTGAVAYKNAQSVKDLRTDGKTTTLYAVWAKKTYKVAFYANGGKGKMATQGFTYGKAKTLASNKFSAPKGKKFAGWATSAAKAKAGVVKYKNKQSVKNLLTTGKTVKLYAVWKKK